MSTKHCHQCGWVWPISGLPGRSDSCHQCGTDMRVCLNCVSYNPKLAHECSDRRAEPVAEKHMATFCEYFDFIKREWAGQKGEDPRADKARDDLKKLLGD